MKSTGEIQSPETIELPGKYLKAKRETQRISLKEVAAATRIRESVLRAIEEDRYENLPGIYIESFVSAYAKCPGLNPNEVITLHKKYAESLSFPNNRVPKQPSIIRTRRVNARVLALWISVVFLIVLIAYASFRLVR